MSLNLGGSGAKTAAFASESSLLAAAKAGRPAGGGSPLFAAHSLLRPSVSRGQHESAIRERRANRHLQVIYIHRRVA
jgi:2-methylcitrate dehydratase PrpD